MNSRSMKLPETISAKRLFAATVVLKVGLSVFGWWMGNTWVAFGGPLLILAAYIWIGAVRRVRDEVSDEKFADSCYYLGFIFTITSIIISLIDLPALGEADKLSEVAWRFGAAMISTVAGLCVRVYLVNFRKDVGDIMQSLADDLLEAERAFRTHLEFAVEGLQNFSVTVNEAAQTVVARLELSIAETAKANSAQITKLFDDVGEKIDSTAQQAANHVASSAGDLQEGLRRYSASLAASTKLHEKRLEEFADKLTSRLDSFSRDFANTLTDLSHEIGQFSRNLDARLNGVDFPAQLFADNLRPPLLDLKVEIGSLADHLRSFSQSIERESSTVLASLKAMPEIIQETTVDIRNAVSEQRRAVDKANAQEEAFLKLARNLKHLETVLQSSSGAIEQQRNSVEKLVSTTSGVLTEHRALTDYASKQAASADGMANQVERLRQTIGDMSEILRNIPREYRGLQEAIVSASAEQFRGTQGGFAELSRDLGRLHALVSDASARFGSGRAAYPPVAADGMQDPEKRELLVEAVDSGSLTG